MYSKIAVKCYWWPFWQDFPTIQKNWQWCIEKTLVSLLTTSHLIPFCEKNLCLDQKKNNSRKWNIILWFWTFSSLKSKNHTYKSISLSIQPKPELNLSHMCIPWKLSEKDKKLCIPVNRKLDFDILNLILWAKIIQLFFSKTQLMSLWTKNYFFACFIES